jgi:outer membrane protein OmpA-like peptidoglycan-associated protein
MGRTGWRMDQPPQPDRPSRQLAVWVPPAAVPSRYPFMPYGLVPLLGLVVLMIVALVPFAFGEVQGATEASARAALQKSGATWATAKVSGQWVVLEGRPPSREAAAAAERVVMQAQADTLFGQAAPATWVISQFTWAEDPLTPQDLLTPRADRPGSPDAATPPPSPAEAAACDQTMASLLATARIEFATKSAAIGAGSDALLDAIASAAGSCRGSLVVEGHTDNVGRAGSNTTLSRRRAEAVRTALIARGVAADRLIAKGFGAANPIASNGSEQGRARNRRIEIRTLRSPPT